MLDLGLSKPGLFGISCVSFRYREVKYLLISGLTDRSRLGFLRADEETNGDKGN